MMVLRRGTYPQVDPRARGLMTRAVVVVPGDVTVEEGARLLRQRRARLLAAKTGRGWGGVTAATLERALRLGLAQASSSIALWRMPVMPPHAPEVLVRRMLVPGTPGVLVGDARGPVGAVLAGATAGPGLPVSLAGAFGRLPERLALALRRAATVGDECGLPVAVVGGLVRDLLLARPVGELADLDLVVEGDARALARRLGEVTGGVVREYSAFLTATVSLPDGLRVDTTTARRERYPRPGALPDVEPAALGDDLWRRDFSINAMAARLDTGAWGEVVDPAGGGPDLRRRRIRVLHPLSFVEDPTRLFRAARFAERLGFSLDGATGDLYAEAVRWPGYGALSGDRLRAELDLALTEPDPAAVLARLGRAGALRLVWPGYRIGVGTPALLRRVVRCAGALPLTTETRGALYLLALTAHLRPNEAGQGIIRLGGPPAIGAMVERARHEAPRLAPRLDRARGAGEAYALLRGVPEAVAAWLLVGRSGGGAVRAHLTAFLRRWRDLCPLLGGDDLQRLGLPAGPALGELLEELRVAQVSGRLRRRAGALRWARAAIARRRRPGRQRSHPAPSHRKGG